MKAEIKKIHSPDVVNLFDYNPESPDNFGFLLQLLIGVKGQKGEESFDLVVCTPKWFLTNFKQNEIIFGRHYLIVFEYNYQNVYNHLKTFVENLDEPNWDSLANKLSRIGFWEFEDYIPQKN